MTIVSFGLLALCALMLLAALAVALARRLRLPATVLFAAIGVTQGVLTTVLGFDAFGGLLDSYDMWFVAQLGFHSDALLAIFLPPLLFEMAIAVNVRRLLDDAALVMVMAVLAVVLATTAVGAAIWLATPIGLIASLLLGAAIATTDPGAVISTFREIGAPKRLTVLLEGESLLNDAAAIAIFGLLLALLRSDVQPPFAAVAAGFFYDFAAGGLIGAGFALLIGRFYPLLARSVAAETSLTLAIAYGAFLIAEMAFSASGVVAVVAAGLVTGTSAYLRMGPGNWRMVQTVWLQIGFWANAMIMILAASLVPGLIAEVGWAVAPLVALAYVATLAARAVILFAAAPVLSALRLAEPLQKAQSLLVLWGGVRGSVTLLLAVSISGLSVLGDDARLLGAVAAVYTLTTIFVNAATLAPLTRALGLNQLTPADLALRDHIVSGALERVRTVIGNIVRARDLEPEALAAVDAALSARRAQAATDEAGRGARASFGERLRVGLKIVSGQEARLVRRAFEDGAIGPRAAAALSLTAERLADAGRIGGRSGYAAAMEQSVRPTPAYRRALRLQQLLGFDGPIRSAIELHLTTLLESERVARDLKPFAAATVAPMIGEDAADNLVRLMETRHARIEAEIEALAIQYPNYAAALERTLVMRAAIRRERQQYQRLFNDGVIEKELLDDLGADLDAREREAAKPPRLDLTLTPLGLLDRVPLFALLTPRQRRRLARAMKTRFTIPGEPVLLSGQRGAEIYFIASGAVEVAGAEGEPAKIVGSGAAIGQIALTDPFKRRTTDVVSLGYCRLLMLRRTELARLGRRDPVIRALIEDAARLGRKGEAAVSPSAEASAPDEPFGRAVADN